MAGPVPLYAWSLIWRGHDDHPLLRTLLDRAVALGRQRRWLDHDPARDWLPAPDLQSLSQQTRARSQGTPPALHDRGGAPVGRWGGVPMGRTSVGRWP